MNTAAVVDSWGAAERITRAGLPAVLADAFSAALPAAGEHVCAQVVAAAYTENLAGFRDRLQYDKNDKDNETSGDDTPDDHDHAGTPLESPPDGARFMRVRATDADMTLSFTAAAGPGSTLRIIGPVYQEGVAGRRRVTDPAEVLTVIAGHHGHVAAELTNSAVNLAIAQARRPTGDWGPGAPTDAVSAAAALAPDSGALFLERLATTGHNLHPCARTRLGMSVTDVLRYDLEGPGLELGVIAVRRDVHTGEDLGALLGLPAAPDGYILQPVHPWQRDHIITTRHAEALRTGQLRIIDDLRVKAAPTASLRTVLTASGHLVKTSLDVQITSTRRSMSVATVRNAPVVSAAVTDILAGTRGVLMGEYAGAGAFLPAGERDATALLRTPLSAVVTAGELAVPANALPARCPHTHRTILRLLADRHPDGPLRWCAEYASVLLEPVLRLTAHGVGPEAHLQNCIPLFRDGRPTRMVFRDLGGARLHTDRMARHGHPVTLWPGSVTATTDIDVVHAKVAYTTIANHLGAIITGLGLGTQGWAVARRAVAEAAAPLLADADVCTDAAVDVAAFMGRVLWHKALLSMRIHPGEDMYVSVDNPLCS